MRFWHWFLRCLFVMLAFCLLLSPRAMAFGKDFEDLSAAIAQKVETAGKKRVGVINFTDLEGNSSKLGMLLADDFSLALTSTPHGLRVIDRIQFDLLLKQHKLEASSLVNPDTASQFGKVSGVEVIILGNATSMGNFVRLSVKAIDLETAEILGTGMIRMVETDHLESLGNPGADLATEGFESRGPAPSQARKEPSSVAHRDFVFQLQGCARSGQSSTCTLLINNMGRDRTLKIRTNEGELVDDAGNSYQASRVEIANSSSENSWWGGAEKMLYYDTPVKTSLTFSGISPEAISIRAVQFVCTDDERVPFNISFRNVAFDAVTPPRIDPNRIAEGEVEGAAPSERKGTLFKTFKGMLKDTLTDVAGEALLGAKGRALSELGKKKEE